MKDNLPSRLLAVCSCAILSFCLAAGGLFCLITAFHLPVHPAALLIPAALCSLLTAALVRFRWSSLALFAAWLLGLGAVLLWDRAALEDGLRCAYTAISTVYSNAYSIIFPTWQPSWGAECTVLFLLWILGAVCLISWAIYQRSAAMAIAFSLLPLAMCLVVVDTPPDLWCLLMLLSSAVLLVLTQSCRRRSARGAGVLALTLLIPVALLVCGLCAAMPPDTYVRGQMADQLMKNAVTWLSKVTSLQFDADGGILLDDPDGDGPALRTLSLEVGPRRNSSRKVMEVRVSEADVMYLRGCTYGNYTGTAWRQLADNTYAGLQGQALTLTVPSSETARTFSIRTQSVHDVIYTPYYLMELPGGLGQPQQDAYLYNSDRLQDYTFTYYVHLPPEDRWSDTVLGRIAGSRLSPDSDPAGYFAFAIDYYTRLPENTRQSMLSLADEAGLTDIPARQLPDAVAAYVRSSATYDLDTPQMPDGEDFATWFLTESDTGYCLHFATAAATMLRALGIPARLVSGYLISAPAGMWTQVTATNAHAWVEYYTGTGWLPLEATPSAGVDDTIGHTEVPITNQPTNPQAPEPSMEPTRPQTVPTEVENSPTIHRTESQPDLQIQWHPPAWLVWLLAAVALFLLRRPVTLELRRRRLARGDANQQLLAHWTYGCRLARRLHEPELPEDLPLKARFSQHAITREELHQVKAWEAGLKHRLLEAPWWKRLYYKWILVLV